MSRNRSDARAARGGVEPLSLCSGGGGRAYSLSTVVETDNLKPIKDLLKMADRSPTDVAQTYMHDPAMTNTTALTKGTSYLRKHVLKASNKNTPAASFSTTALAQGRPLTGEVR